MSAVVRLALPAAALLVACGHDGTDPGVRGPCELPGGATLGCTPPVLETPEDVCWRLVECGAIPVANPEDDPDCCLDWADCVEDLAELPGDDLAFTLACVAAAPCSELVIPGSPDRPTRNDEELPTCLQHGSR